MARVAEQGAAPQDARAALAAGIEVAQERLLGFRAAEAEGQLFPTAIT